MEIQTNLNHNINMKRVLRFTPVLLFFALTSFVVLQYPEWVSPGKKESGKIVRYSSLLSVLFQQRAAEMQAVSWQAYNIAKLRLDEYLQKPKPGKQPAIVVDIDETVLYKSKYQAKAIRKGFGYPKEWKDWILKKEADTLPGAAYFINYAESKGVRVLYISNRKEEFRLATLENLKNQNLDSITDDRLFLRTGPSSKETRRRQVAEKYEIILLIGDNLADFHLIWDDITLKNRSEAVEKFRMEFGSKFIIIPNPVYGDWVEALLEGTTPLNDLTRAQKLMNQLVPF